MISKTMNMKDSQIILEIPLTQSNKDSEAEI